MSDYPFQTELGESLRQVAAITEEYHNQLVPAALLDGAGQVLADGRSLPYGHKDGPNFHFDRWPQSGVDLQRIAEAAAFLRYPKGERQAISAEKCGAGSPTHLHIFPAAE